LDLVGPVGGFIADPASLVLFGDVAAGLLRSCCGYSPGS